MTSERDFDRLARAWLDLGPNEAPDRVVAAVLQAAETTPQVRRPFLRPFWRSYRMTRLSIAAIAVVLVALIGGGIMLTRGGDQTVGGPAATSVPTTVPSVTPSASAAAQVSQQIQGTWMGGTRSLPAVATGAGTALQLSPAGLEVSQSAGTGQPGLSAQASSPADGRLHVVTGTRDPAGCAVGVAGDYTWALSPSGRSLTITPVSDPCAVRMSALAGDWLQKACKDTSDNCLGDLDPGTYKSQFITPRLKPGESWEPHYGAVTYTVPDGWANSGDWPDELGLVPSADYASFGPKGLPNGAYHEVTVIGRPAPNEQTADCTAKEVTTVKRTVSGLVDWIRAQPSLTSTKPTDITVGGRPAQWLDVKVAPGWTKSCPDVADGSPTAVFLTVVGNTDPSKTWGIGGKEQIRLVFVDIGGGDVALIWVDDTDPARFDQLASDAMPIIESMTFE